MTGPSGLGDNMKIDTEMLCSFIDGELDAATAAAVRAALEADENLRRDYEDLRKTAELVRGLPKVSAPPELAEAITAQAERDQLLGQSPPVHAGRSRLYWGLSVAASLLVGVAVGILGYHGWQGQPQTRDGSALVMSTEDELVDYPEWHFSGKADSPASSSDTSAADGRSTSREGGEEIAGLTETGRRRITAKGGSYRSARAGPKTGEPAKSFGGANGPLAEKSPVPGQLATVQPVERIAAAEEATQQDLTRTGQQEEESLALGYRGGASFSKAVRPGDIPAERLDVQYDQAGLAKLPLERQVILNNYVNQTMTANHKFAVEPLNVRVVSNDTTKTLQYVQRWAAKNSLIDLNKASARMNLPVYAQVIYEGKLGTNIEASQDNGVLVRTSRVQARQIIADLQQQKPLVVSVSVRDEKNSLGLDAEQLQRRELGDLAGRRQGVSGQAALTTDRLPAAEPIPEKQVEQRGTSLGIPLAGTRKDVDKEGEVALQSESRYFERHRAPVDELRGDDSYLLQITNQMQVQSLADLVTLVVLVEDAKRAAITQPASQTAPPTSEQSQPQIQAPHTDPEATESE